MDKSESITELAAALSTAQSEIENAHKNAQNPFFRSNYADLAEIINTVRPVLTKHGLAVVQIPGLDGAGNVTVETMLVHKSGEWISGLSGSPMPPKYDKNGGQLPPDAQTTGSAITYLRRYALSAVCAIAQEDDDGNAASTPRSTGQPASQNGAPGFACPACGGETWDNRADKASGQKKPTFPDLKCRDKACEWAVWLSTWRDDLLTRIAAVHQAEVIDVDTRMQAEEVAKEKEPGRMVKLDARVKEWELEVEKKRLGADAEQGSLV